MSLHFHQHSSIVNIFQLNTVGVTSRSRSTIALEQMTVDFHDSPAGETYDFNADYPLGPWRARCTVLGAWLIQFCTMGVILSYGVFQDFYITTQLNNHSPAVISVIGGTQISLIFALGPVSGRLFDSCYARTAFTSGSLLYVLSFLMLSFVEPSQWYQAFLAQGVGMGLGAGLLCLPSYAVAADHFKSRRGLITGIVQSGSAFGGVVFSIILNHLFRGPFAVGFGWGTRDATLIVMNLLILGNLLIFVPPHPPLLSPSSPSVATIRDTPFLITLAWAFVPLIGLYFPLFYIQTFARMNGPYGLAFYSPAILNAAGILGCLLPHLAANRIGTLRVLVPVTIISGLIQFAIFGSSSAVGLIIFLLIFGMFSRATITLYFPLILDLKPGNADSGKRIWIGCFPLGAAALFGPPVTGAIIGPGFAWAKGIAFAAVMTSVSSILLIAAWYLYTLQAGRDDTPDRTSNEV